MVPILVMYYLVVNYLCIGFLSYYKEYNKYLPLEVAMSTNKYVKTVELAYSKHSGNIVANHNRKINGYQSSKSNK